MGCLAMNWGCTHSLKTRTLPSSDQTTGKLTHDIRKQSEGVAYFLPSGRLHLVATLVTNFVTTNYAIAYETLADGTMVTNFVTKIKIITNTVTSVSSNIVLSVAKPQKGTTLEPVLVSSNITIIVSNVPPPAPNAAPAATNVPPPEAKAAACDQNPPPSFVTNQTTTLITSNLVPTYYPSSVWSKNHVRTVITTEQPMTVTNYYYNISMSVDYVPDKSRLYLLKPHRSLWYDDNVNLTVNNGLLCSVTTTNTDQTGGVIQAMAQTAGQIFTLAAGGLPISATGAGGVSPTVQLMDYSTQVDKYARLLPDEIDPTNIASRIESVNLNLAMGLPKADLGAIQSYFEAWRHAGEDEKYAQLEFAAFQASAHNLSNEQIKSGINDFEIRLGRDRETQRNAEANLRPELTNVLSSYIAHGKSPTLEAMRHSDIPFREVTIKLYQQLIADNKSTSQPLLRRLIIEDAFPKSISPCDHKLPPPNQKLPEYIDISFDPSDPVDVANASTNLIAAGLTLSGTDDLVKDKNSFAYINNATAEETGGIYYRPALPYSISLTDRNGNKVTRSLLFPNTAPILNINFKKAPFVTTVNQVTMTNGFISSYGMNKPSTALAFAGLPSAIISSFVGGITNVIQMRFNIATAQNNLANSQLAAAVTNQSMQLQSINNTLAILTAQQNLYQFIKTNTPH